MIEQNGIPVREVVLHCAAIRTGQFKDWTPFQVFAEVNRWHRERGFKNGFGYHGIVMDGQAFYPGRPLSMVGAHCIEVNRKGTWGLLLIENRKIEKIGDFADYYTELQARTLKAWLRQWPQLEKVTGHNRYAKKLCPGFEVRSSDWL